MKLTRRGNILANGRIRRTQHGFAKEKLDNEHTGNYCNRCGHRFCYDGEGLDRVVKLVKQDLKKQCDDY